MSLRGRKWVFTWNNYPENYKVFFNDAVLRNNAVIKSLCFGEEIAPTTGTPHLQCALWLRDKITNPAQKLGLGNNWQIARNWKKAVQYCKKGNQSHDEWTSDGIDGDSYGIGAVVWEIIGETTQGTRNDLEDFKKSVLEAEGHYTFSDALVEHSEVCARYSSFVKAFIALKRGRKQVAYHALRPWQAALNHELNLPPDERKIKFIVDTLGNKGKTWFTQYYRMNHDKVQILPPAKAENMAYLADETCRVFFIDLPREKTEYFSWSFLEQLKNGHFFSTKYTPVEKFLDTPHVVVMTNIMPDMTKLSADRYDVVNLDLDRGEM